MRIFKKASGKKTVTHAEALDVALCFGWIDGQRKGLDEESFLQKFTPRGRRSIWSKLNRKHVQRLVKEGRMREQGMAQVRAAKKDGRWQAAYDSPSNMKIPAEFLVALKRNRKAHQFFLGLNRTNLFSIGWRLQTAIKAETKLKRTKDIISMLEKGKKFHG